MLAGSKLLPPMGELGEMADAITTEATLPLQP